MPVVGLRHRVPGPVGCLEIFENNSRVLVSFRRVAPDIKVFVSKIVITVAGVSDPRRPFAAAVSARGYKAVFGNSAPRLSEPLILIGRVIDYEFGDNAQIALMRG